APWPRSHLRAGSPFPRVLGRRAPRRSHARRAGRSPRARRGRRRDEEEEEGSLTGERREIRLCLGVDAGGQVSAAGEPRGDANVLVVPRYDELSALVRFGSACLSDEGEKLRVSPMIGDHGAHDGRLERDRAEKPGGDGERLHGADNAFMSWVALLAT